MATTHLDLGIVSSWDIDRWRSAGMPMTLKARLAAGMRAGCRCNNIKELAAPPSVLEKWLQVCPGCAAQVQATRGLPFVPGTGFAATPVSPEFTPILPAAEAPAVIPPAPPPSGFQRMMDLPALRPTSDTQTGITRPQIQPTQPGGTVSTRTRTVGVVPGANPFDITGAITGGLGGFVTGGPIGAITGGLLGGFGGETGAGGKGRGFTTGQPTCGPGYVWRNGRCEKEGFGGFVERVLPGGEPGYVSGGPNGAGGPMPQALSRQPEVLTTVRRRCGRGMVLGYDGLCYDKRTISNKQRMWPKGPQPLLTGGERKILRRAKSLKNKAKRAAMGAGFSCTPRKSGL